MFNLSQRRTPTRCQIFAFHLLECPHSADPESPKRDSNQPSPTGTSSSGSWAEQSEENFQVSPPECKRGLRDRHCVHVFFVFFFFLFPPAKQLCVRTRKQFEAALTAKAAIDLDDAVRAVDEGAPRHHRSVFVDVVNRHRQPCLLRHFGLNARTNFSLDLFLECNHENQVQTFSPQPELNPPGNVTCPIPNITS